MFVAHLTDGTEQEFARQTVHFIDTDYRQSPYGALLEPHLNRYRERHEIYGSGPSLDTPIPATLGLLRRYLPRPPSRILDVGCGLGTYGSHLLTEGYDWFGIEVDEADCAQLAKREMPHRRTAPGEPLPLADESFDAAMCIEVLEHVSAPMPFLQEIRRIAPALVVSVPSVELLPYLSAYRCAPWHMLESDHKNFFNRWGLHALLGQFYGHVEVFSYSPMPMLSREGTQLDYHLFALASA